MLSGCAIKTYLNLKETYISLRKERQRTNLSAMTKSSFARKQQQNYNRNRSFVERPKKGRLEPERACALGSKWPLKPTH